MRRSPLLSSPPPKRASRSRNGCVSCVHCSRRPRRQCIRFRVPPTAAALTRGAVRGRAPSYYEAAASPSRERTLLRDGARAQGLRWVLSPWGQRAPATAPRATPRPSPTSADGAEGKSLCPLGTHMPLANLMRTGNPHGVECGCRKPPCPFQSKPNLVKPGPRRKRARIWSNTSLVDTISKFGRNRAHDVIPTPNLVGPNSQ